MRVSSLSPIAVACALALAPALPVRAQTPTASSAEMTRLFDADQADRTEPVDWDKVGPRDLQRQNATRKLLEAGALHTGEDFLHAAFIFQHGDAPDDFLLAHTLAMVAVGKGQREALWIASATLDRYLITLQRPQIYGTQFRTPDMSKPEVTQEPYNRTLVSDALRGELGVPSAAQQASRLEGLRQAQAKALAPNP